MPKIAYIERRFAAGTLDVIDKANTIIAEYAAQGFVLTLRQLYYQFVSRDFIANKQTEYDRLGSIINDARLAGLIDWEAIEDRTRELESVSHWNEPSEIVSTAADSFRIDKWATQKIRPEVWIEKDALAGVFEGVCRELDVAYLSCRGYTSQSEMWRAGRRLARYRKLGQTPFILHFGDHDPSGIDMTRDIRERLEMFIGAKLRLLRVALNKDQVDQYDPPPNPAKMTDSRFAGYVAEYGDESWELDALEPATLAALVRAQIETVRDEAKWRKAVGEETEHRTSLAAIAERYDEVRELVTN
ncbi:MAG TPA: hypothetical protein VGS01_09595 [Candidatus Limnocylindria bacterium]|nr:hypothetical protein [Candidatus Limnocylindria bacterium]